MDKIINIEKYKRVEEEMNIFDIARAFLSISSMSNKKLQKLCYYAQAWHLALMGNTLIDCKFEAWIHGPVCPDLYYEYKKYGYKDIPMTNLPANIEQNQEVYNFINTIYEVYGNCSADDLEFMTHNEQPWKLARKNLLQWELSHEEIKNEDMMNYYSNILSTND